MTDRLSIAQAVAALRGGQTIAYPTEGVWGLGCDPFDAAAVRALLAIKQRDEAKGLILIAASFAQVAALIDAAAMPSARMAAVLATWPGPHTWLLPCSAHVPDFVRGAHPTLALRVSAHPDVIALCEAFGGPVVSTSANLAGEPPARTAPELSPALRSRIAGVLRGETGGLDAPTPIRDALSGAVLRV